MPDLDFAFPALDIALFKKPMQDDLAVRRPSIHAPRFLMLYGSLRERSYSRLLTYEAVLRHKAVQKCHVAEDAVFPESLEVLHAREASPAASDFPAEVRLLQSSSRRYCNESPDVSWSNRPLQPTARYPSVSAAVAPGKLI